MNIWLFHTQASSEYRISHIEVVGEYIISGFASLHSERHT